MSRRMRVWWVLVCAAVLLLSTTVGVRADGRYHVVRPGETLYSIGRLYGVNPYDIAAANSLANPNIIYVGQYLHIPGCCGPPGPAPVTSVRAVRQYQVSTYPWWPVQAPLRTYRRAPYGWGSHAQPWPSYGYRSYPMPGPWPSYGYPSYPMPGPGPYAPVVW